jgi:putative peptide zinc metalloprotease protein
MAQTLARGTSTTTGAHAQSSLGVEVPERPALAADVQLIGELQGTGFKDRQWLVQRNGRFVQVTEVLYRIAEQVDGQHTVEEIAAGVTEATEWSVSADDVRHILRVILIPQGFVVPAGGFGVLPRQDPVRSPLLVNMRLRMLGPRVIDPIARVLQVLYAPPVLIPMLVAIVLAHWWVYFVHGLSGSLQAAMLTPGGMVWVIALSITSNLFHEFGHAAALRYAGARAGGIGFGLYLVYPVFYTQASESYRLGRWARVRTDVGGFYFHLVFAVAIVAFAYLSGQDLPLLIVLLINMDLVRQCLPFVRMDGYWALADLTGLPDFFALLGPFVMSHLPRRPAGAATLPPLKPWVKAVFTAYMVITVPLLAIVYVLMIKGAPFIIATTWNGLGRQAGLLFTEHSIADAPLMLAAFIQMVFLALPIAGIAYMFYAVGRKLVRGIWKWSRPTPLRRVTGALGTAGLVGLLGFWWAPQLPVDQLPFTRPAPPDGVQYYEVTDRAHVQVAVDYPQTPPVGGNHAPIWQNCGFYAQPVADETAVHSMEHGAVWITYKPDLLQSQLESLQQLARGQSYVLVSPRSDLPTSVVASAWGRQLQLESVDDARLKQFVIAFRNGDQAPERGGPCSGGRGSPA